eukprot:TRINITY_DN2775_c0_g1_i8.p2 TRINITY_DN2775_c0_g1~~TRINITY_DN2775_c0_g1_i8.p2  ORF type:complete len:103 (+),score=0.08 TRINITY_DN2775_c0_g1_i8:65-373(+)
MCIRDRISCVFLHIFQQTHPTQFNPLSMAKRFAGAFFYIYIQHKQSIHENKSDERKPQKKNTNHTQSILNLRDQLCISSPFWKLVRQCKKHEKIQLALPVEL